MIGNQIFAEMGSIAQKRLKGYFGDLMHDGVYLEKYRNHTCFLWVVRECGTHLVALNEYLQTRSNTPYFQQLGPEVGFYFIEFFISDRYEGHKRLDFGEVTEITKEQALALLND